jgi:predicted alpha/beta hydrolase family esterase
MSTAPITYLILPGWQGSPAEHWQSHWQNSLPNARRVEQDDWQQPEPRAWVARLDENLRQAPGEVILVAHSLGCITVANWAADACAGVLNRVRGALLVAPADVERANCPEALRGFAPIASRRLPFPTQVIGSSNDPAASVARVLELARGWGSEVAILDGAGHINVKSGHQRWDQGFGYLYRLQQRIEDAARRQA